MKNQHINRLKEFFEVYPEENECILFSDGQIFTLKNENYAKMFEEQSGKKSIRVTRDEVLKIKTKTAPVKTDSKEKDNEFDLATAKKSDLIAFAEKNNIEVNKRDKVDVIREAIKIALAQIEASKTESPEGDETDLDDKTDDTPGSEGDESPEDDESQEEGEDYKPI